jgi:hypothetical protein
VPTDARDARHSTRVAHEGAAADTTANIRDVRQSVRVAHQYPTTEAWLLAYTVRTAVQRLATVDLVSYVVRVLRSTIPEPPPTVNLWNGTTFEDAPVRVWNGTAFVNALAVKVWNGTAFVDAI